MVNKRHGKKRLLITWGNPYIFNETIVPIIPKLAEEYLVSIITVDSFMPSGLVAAIESMRENGLIEKYWILPDTESVFRHQFYLKSHIGAWREMNFDIQLSGSEIQIYEHYINSCSLPAHCLRVCFWTGLGYMLKDERFVNKLLGIQGNPDKTERNVRSYYDYSRILERVRSAGLINIVKRVFEKIKIHTVVKLNKAMSKCVNRYILPLLLVRKVFPLNKRDIITQMGSGRSDAYVFCDKKEAQVFSAFVKNSVCYVAEYPVENNCRCGDLKKNKSAVLISLTTGISAADKLDEKGLELFHRDIKIVLTEARVSTVHLRIHPRMKMKWPYHLQEYLNMKGIDAQCSKSDLTIKEIVCDYQGVVGPASTVLRIARACCDSCFVVGFAGISKRIFKNPRFAFGGSEGIGWIDENGVYDPIIFKAEQYKKESKMSLYQILNEISKRRSQAYGKSH